MYSNGCKSGQDERMALVEPTTDLNGSMSVVCFGLNLFGFISVYELFLQLQMKIFETHVISSK